MDTDKTQPGWFARDGWLWVRSADGTETSFAPAPEGEPYIPTKEEWEQLLKRVAKLEAIAHSPFPY